MMCRSGRHDLQSLDDRSAEREGCAMARDVPRSVSVLAMVEQALPDAGSPVVPKAFAKALSRDVGNVHLWASLAGALNLSDLRPTLADDVELPVFPASMGERPRDDGEPGRVIHSSLRCGRRSSPRRWMAPGPSSDIVIERLDEDRRTRSRAVVRELDRLAARGQVPRPARDNVPAHLPMPSGKQTSLGQPPGLH